MFSRFLLSKYGFNDGDLLEWINEHNREYDTHATLIACVRRKMLPVLNRKVEICEICCIHNPCRAETVDGVSVTDRWFDPVIRELDPPLLPECVVMTGKEVLEIAEELRLIAENNRKPNPVP